jgi:putative restriction endonuclease
MPSLTNASLFGRLKSALPPGTNFLTPANAIHPAIFVAPGLGKTRAYLFTVTRDRSEAGKRPAGEFKIQLIIDGQARSARGSLDHDEANTVLLGYSPDFGVFVGWEARLYREFAYSANVQIREPTLADARAFGWSVAAPRSIRGSSEVRVALPPGNLPHYLRASREADRKEIWGVWREALMLSKMPNFSPGDVPRRERDLPEHIKLERQRITSSRLSRDARFAPRVKEQFDFSCAVCGLQLEIVEAAHIIPVNDERSSDDIWNGLALCPSHHTLFDARRFVVEANLALRVDRDAVAFLEQSGRASGIELLLDYDGDSIQPPAFWAAKGDLRTRMTDALTYVSSTASPGY